MDIHYINYLRNHGYMPKVANKHLTNLKALIYAAFIDGVHDNQRAASLIVKNKIGDRDKAVEIYLTEAELQALYEMPLTGKNDQIPVMFFSSVAIPVSITNMFPGHKYTILQVMHVSGHKTQKTFMNYIRLSS